MGFILLSVRDTSSKKYHEHGIIKSDKTREYLVKGEPWHEISLVPYYIDDYWCLTNEKDAQFERLFDLFLKGNDAESIGAISLLAYNHTDRLLLEVKLLYKMGELSRETRSFLIKIVIPDFLPLIIDRRNVEKYIFPKEYLNDKWVDLLQNLKMNNSILRHMKRSKNRY